MEFAIENGTYRTLEVPPPDPEAAGVAIYVEPGAARVCGVEPSVRSPAGTVQLAPGDQVAVRVDLDGACGALGPGEYRYELTYKGLATRYGTVVVNGGPARNAGRPAGPPPRPPSARIP